MAKDTRHCVKYMDAAISIFEICTVMNCVNVDFCMRMEVLMALQQMWGWLIIST